MRTRTSISAIGIALAVATLLSITLHTPSSSFSTTGHRRSLRALQQRLDAGVQLQSTPKPTADQVANFRRCIDEYTSGKSSGGSSSAIVTEAGGRSQLTVTLQQDGGRYGTLKNLNAQKRGEKLTPLAFAEPGRTADVATVVR
jgi:hypothetical protein